MSESYTGKYDMKLVKFHKFICKHDKSQKCKTDVYVNPEKVTWIEEVVDDGRRHACIYLEGDDFIDVFEQLDEVAKTLEQYNIIKEDKSNECKVKQDNKEVNSQSKDKKVKKVSRKRKPKVDRTEECEAVKEVQSIVEEDQGTSLGQCS